MYTNFYRTLLQALIKLTQHKSCLRLSFPSWSLTEPNGVDMYDFDGANSNKAGEIQVMSSPGEAQKNGEN